MREIRQSGSEGGEAELNRPSLPLSVNRSICFGVRTNREDRAVEGLLAVGAALTRGYRCGRFLLSPAWRPLFARFGLGSASGGTPLLPERERRRKDCC